MPTRHVVLIGSMGAGKTTIGDRVARALGRPLVDSDRVLAAEGPDAAVIARTEGVAELHDRECHQLRTALASPEPAVIAAAASVVEAPACRSALAGHVVVWLHADPEVAASRVAAARRRQAGAGSGEASPSGSGDHRRDLGADPVGALRALAARRDPLYRAVATLEVDVEALTPDEAATRIVEAVRAVTARADGPGR